MFKNILLAYDGSEGAERALAAAIELAQVHGAELTALAVQERLPRFSGTIDEVQEEKEFANQQSGQLLDGAQAQARAAGVKLKSLMRPGHPAKTILEVAKEGTFDLIIVGHSGLSGVWALLGHHREKVSRHAPCSVLIVR